MAKKKNRAERTAKRTAVATILLTLYNKSQNYLRHRTRRKAIPQIVRN